MDDTSGRVDPEDMVECSHCGDRFNDGDGYWAGAWEDQHICSYCCENNHTYAYSRRGNEYYINSDDVICVDGNYYDENFLGDNEIVVLRNGDYARLEASVEIDGDWYETDDEDICYAEDTDEYALKEDCWMCTHSDRWYTNRVENVEINGELFHPKYAPETNEGESE
jgi:hypothetical protein